MGTSATSAVKRVTHNNQNRFLYANADSISPARFFQSLSRSKPKRRTKPVTFWILADIVGVSNEGSGRRSDVVLSFDDLYSLCARDVYRFAVYLSGDRALAEDLTSEAFMRAWNSDEPVRTQTVKAYLFTIVRHLYLREQVRRSRQRPLAVTIVDTEADLERALDQKKRFESVIDALRQLPEIDRSVLLMRASEDMSYHQIAKSLGLSLTAVKVRIHRARVKLAQLWSVS
jgi:RNA polymerase sigma-70 factor, ECF subfamily